MGHAKVAKAIAFLAVCLAVVSAAGFLLVAGRADKPGPPLPSGTKRTAVKPVEMGENSCFFTFVSSQSPAAVYSFIEKALKDGDWKVVTSRHYDNGVWMLMANKDEDDGQVMAMIQGRDRGKTPGTLINLTLSGPGVKGTLYDNLPVEEVAATKPDTTIPPGVLQPGLKPPVKVDPLTAGPPNEFQQSIAGYEKPASQLVDALLAWCTSPTESLRVKAIAAAARYVKASKSLQDQASVWVDKLGPSSGSGRILADLAQLDPQLGSIVLCLEKMKKVDLPKLRKLALPRLKKIKDEELKKLLAANKQVKEIVNIAKKDPSAVAVTDNPLTIELINQTEEPPFEPSTNLTVTRFWTPTKEYWEGVLPMTWAVLKAWNAGCPKGCKYVDDEGKHFSCKAFGIYETAKSTKPEDVHCLNIEKSKENEKLYLSHPMSLYGLVSLAVEVGDPDQMKKGGKVDFYINGEFLFSSPLDPVRRPFPGSNSPYGIMSDLEGVGGVSFSSKQNPLNKWLEGIEMVFGDEAADNFKNASRSPRAMLESAGGEFNGYVLFTQVGQVAGEAMARYDVIMPPVAAVDPISYALKLIKISEKNHPALQRDHKITAIAEVGGVRSEPVEIKVPAVFKDLSKDAGVFDGWPEGDPDKWKFGSGLGELSDPVAPPKIDVDPNAAVHLYEDTKKMAMVYTYIILSYWFQKIEDASIDLALKNYAKPWAKAKASKYLEGSKTLEGMKMISNSVESYVKVLPNDQAVTGMGKFTLAKLTDTMKGAGFEKLQKAMGLSFKETARKLRDLYENHCDPTIAQLREWAHVSVASHRLMIRLIAEAQLTLKRDANEAMEKVKFDGDLMEALFGPFGAEVNYCLKAACYGAEAGIALTDLNAIREIWRRVELVKQITDNPRAWLGHK